MIPQDIEQRIEKTEKKQSFVNEAFKLKIAELFAKVDSLLELAGLKEEVPEEPEAEEVIDADAEADEF